MQSVRDARLTRIALLMVANLCCARPGQSDIVCATCHPRETARYLESPMGNSIGPPVSIARGRVTHPRSGSAIDIERQGDTMVHRLSKRGLTAEYAIAYQIGAGRIAHSYITRVDEYLFESPATWFKAAGWDLSPGYAAAPLVDFDRPITETCLFCHANAARFSGSDGRRVDSQTVTAISCERCHGSLENHLGRPAAANIVNPAKLPNRARDSICAVRPARGRRGHRQEGLLLRFAELVDKQCGAGFSPMPLSFGGPANKT